MVAPRRFFVRKKYVIKNYNGPMTRLYKLAKGKWNLKYSIFNTQIYIEMDMWGASAAFYYTYF